MDMNTLAGSLGGDRCGEGSAICVKMYEF